MIRYYNNDKFLGYLVGTCPKTGKPVIVGDDLKYFTPDVITHQKIDNTVLDERVERTRINSYKVERAFEVVTTTPWNYKTPTL